MEKMGKAQKCCPKAAQSSIANHRYLSGDERVVVAPDGPVEARDCVERWLTGWDSNLDDST